MLQQLLTTICKACQNKPLGIYLCKEFIYFIYSGLMSEPRCVHIRILSKAYAKNVTAIFNACQHKPLLGICYKCKNKFTEYSTHIAIYTPRGYASKM